MRIICLEMTTPLFTHEAIGYPGICFVCVLPCNRPVFDHPLEIDYTLHNIACLCSILC